MGETAMALDHNDAPGAECDVPAGRSPARSLAGMSSRAFLEAAAGWAKGRPALVVSCGPSMRRWLSVLSDLRGAQPLVVCVKQSVEEVGAYCDLHVFNAYNVQRYNYGTASPLIIAGTAPGAPQLREASDYRYQVQGGGAAPGGLFDESVAFTGAFAAHELGRTGLDARPWGPGIMYEIVFPLLVHMGVSRIFTVGWDIASADGTNLHYYDANRARHEDRRRGGSCRVAGCLLRRFADSRPVSGAVNGLRRRAGLRYNPAAMLPGEAAVVSRSLPHLRSWLHAHDIGLQILSDSEWISDSRSSTRSD